MNTWRVLLLVFVLLAPATVKAEGIRVKSAEFSASDEYYNLNARFDIRFNPTLEEALKRGVSLNFVTEVELVKTRWYWMDEKIYDASWNTKLVYNALTRQYRLSSGSLYQNVDNLPDAVRLLGSILNRQSFNKSILKKSGSYTAKVRMGLDVSQLPKPFQVDALASSEWDLSSDWFVWDFTP